MKKLRVLLVVVLALVLSLSLFACGDKTEEPAKEETKTEEKAPAEESKEEQKEEENYYPLTYVTFNRAKEPVEVTLEKEPERIVAVYQNSIETLLALGLEDKIVAAAGLDHKVKPELEEAFKKVKYLDDWQPTKETVVLEEPDFILSWYSYFGEKRLGDVGYFHDQKIGTYMALNSGCVSPRTLDNERQDLLNLGRIFNKNEEAAALVAKIDAKIEEAVKKSEGKDKVTVLLIEKNGDTFWSYGETSLGGDMILKLGADLKSRDGNDLGVEDILAIDPDVIFSSYYNGGERTDEEAEALAIDSVLKDEKLQNLKAVKNGKVYAIPLGEFYASGIRTIDGLDRFFKGIYE